MIKEYLPLLIGQKCEFKISGHSETYGEYGIIVGMPVKGTEWTIYIPEDGVEVYAFAQDIKPLLRPLGDMTEEEKKEYNERKQRKGYMYRVHAENTMWLLSKGFDIFHLIEKQLAITKTT